MKIVLCFTLFLTSRNPIRFFQENISIKVYPDKIIKVEGIYYFKNTLNLPVSIIMRYPFPVDEYHYYPFYIDIPNIYFERKDNDIIMPVNFKPFEIKKIKVIYKQKLKDKKARYILKTTEKWGKPLQEAFFKIEVPVCFKNIHLSYKADSFEILKDKKIFYIHKKNFFPKKDLLIEWEK